MAFIYKSWVLIIFLLSANFLVASTDFKEPFFSLDCLSGSLEGVLVRAIEVNDFKRNHSEFSIVKSSDNYSFKRFADQIRSAVKQDYIFVDVETTVLKILNDYVFRDLELSSAVKNRYKELFFETLQKDAKLSKYLVEKYSDFKRNRLAFRIDGTTESVLTLRLNKLLGDSAVRFAEEINNSSFLKFYLSLEGLSFQIKNPQLWNVMGVGYFDDHASIAARYARELIQSGKDLSLVRFEDIVELVESDLKSLENRVKSFANRYHEKYSTQFVLKSPYEAIGNDSQYRIPSIQIIRIIRNIQSQGHVASSEVDIFLKEMSLKGVSFTRKEAVDFFEFYRLINKLSLPPYIPQGDFPFHRATHGVLNMDLDGVGAESVELTSQFLLKNFSEGVFSADAALVASRAAVNSISESLKGVELFLKDAFKLELSTLYRNLEVGSEFNPTRSWFSGGDDFSVLPEVDLSVGHLKKVLLGILQNLDAKKYLHPEKLRIIYVMQKTDKGEDVPPLVRALIAKKADLVLKQLKSKIESDPLLYENSKKALIALRVTPTLEGIGMIQPLLVKKDSDLLDHLSEKAIQDIISGFCKELVFRCTAN